VSTTNFGPNFVFRACGRTQDDLDVFGSALTDRDAVDATNVALYSGVDVERTDAHRLNRDDATQRNQRGLGRAATDVDDHVAHRLVDRQARADRGSHRLFDQLCVSRASPAGRFFHCAPLDGRDGRGHADHDARPVEAADANSLQ